MGHMNIKALQGFELNNSTSHGATGNRSDIRSGMRLETQLSTAQLTRRDRSRNKNLDQFHTTVVPQMMSSTSLD
ncbi:unnamed protein product [Miscanthus lutarioriparius]|uniref:Uncharacterized protein n=1 Tax=Miscanthus lutarioriparius TaxID=422564 RepID=A0A811NU09_9POAL|nr:unnamed protein product [Miscanthus lutarioriparius]